MHPVGESFLGSMYLDTITMFDPSGPCCPLNVEDLTSDERQREVLRRDPRRYDGYIMNRTALEIRKLTEETRFAVKEINYPFLCVHGGDDQVAQPEGSRYIYTNAKTAKAHKKITIFDGALHEVFNERKPIDSKAITEVVTFLQKRTQSGKER
jgi:alpha-beta hydrolase superfamily lysophospholipase